MQNRFYVNRTIPGEAELDRSRQYARWVIWGMPVTTVGNAYNVFENLIPANSLIRVENISRSLIGPQRPYCDRPTVMFDITTSAPRPRVCDSPVVSNLHFERFSHIYCHTISGETEKWHDVRLFLNVLHFRSP